MNALVQDKDISRWQAELKLGFEFNHPVSQLKHTWHTGPLRVQRPFYPEEDLPHVYILHPPGGVVASDRLDITVEMDNKAQALLTTPGSTKFYRSNNSVAEVRQHLIIGEYASLEWFPQENILFPGARVNSQTKIELSHNATFMGWEMVCLGRPSIDERFDNGSLFNRIEIFRQQKPQLRECLRIDTLKDLSTITGLRSYPMMALFVATPCDETHLAIVRELIEKARTDFPIAATLLDDLLVIRILGYQTEAIQRQLIPIWQVLRPMLLNRAAILPRIWAT